MSASSNSKTEPPRGRPSRAPAGVSSRTKLLATSGVVAAGVIALFVNVLASRHYRRFDATRARLYTLSEPTDYTLDQLESQGQDVELFVFVGGGDPLLASLKQILATYQARAPRHLFVRYLDPDRDRAEFVRLRAELDVNAKGESGRIYSDAQVVVRHAERIWYVKTDDMIVLDEGDDAKVRPRVEAAVTSAIRAVLTTDRPRVCFTYGHHEAQLDDPGPKGLSSLKNTLAKDNFKPDGIDATKPNVSYAGCVMIGIVAPEDTFRAAEAKPIVDAVKGGTALLLVASPEISGPTGMAPPGLDDVAALAGVSLDDAVAVEELPELREPNGLGLILRARVHAHPTTDDLRKFAEERGAEPAVPLVWARPLRKSPTNGASPQELLVTSDQSYALHDVVSFLASEQEPRKGKDDRSGPLDLAEITVRDPSVGGARAIVVGSSTPFINTAYLDASPLMTLSRTLGLIWIAWLTARPPILDLPPKPSVQIAMHLSEDDIGSIGRYVLMWMPLAAGLLGGAVWLRRRSTEGKRPRGEARGRRA